MTQTEQDQEAAVDFVKIDELFERGNFKSAYDELKLLYVSSRGKNPGVLWRLVKSCYVQADNFEYTNPKKCEMLLDGRGYACEGRELAPNDALMLKWTELMAESANAYLKTKECNKSDYERKQIFANTRVNASIPSSSLLLGFAVAMLFGLQFTVKPSTMLLVVDCMTVAQICFHLIAFVMTSHLQPHLAVAACNDEPFYIRVKWLIRLSWIFTNCFGILLILFEVAVMFYAKHEGSNLVVALAVAIGAIIFVMGFLCFFIVALRRALQRNHKSRKDNKKQTIDPESLQFNHTNGHHAK